MTPETEETINRLLQNNILLRLKNEELTTRLAEIEKDYDALKNAYDKYAHPVAAPAYNPLRDGKPTMTMTEIRDSVAAPATTGNIVMDSYKQMVAMKEAAPALTDATIKRIVREQTKVDLSETDDDQLIVDMMNVCRAIESAVRGNHG